MQRLSVAAAGNADENTNLINARFQAEALRRIRGYDCGVLDNSFYSGASPKGLVRDKNADFMWKLTATNVADIAVGRGMATAYGFDIQSEATVHFTAVAAPSAGVKYYFIYLEWDLSNPVEANGKIDIFDNGSSANWTPPRQDNLITNPIGVYQMPLYRLTVNTSGTVLSAVNWSVLGVLTLGNVLRSEYAGRSDTADNADNSNAIAGESAGTDTEGNLTLGGKTVLRRKKIFDDWWRLSNATDVQKTLTMEESLSDGDILMVEYAPQYKDEAVEKAYYAEIVVRVGALWNHSTYTRGFTLTYVLGSSTLSQGLSAAVDSFKVSGKTLTYLGGYFIKNFTTSGQVTAKNNTIAIRKIYKLFM